MHPFKIYRPEGLVENKKHTAVGIEHLKMMTVMEILGNKVIVYDLLPASS
jgi:hypothetical protein